MDDRRASETLEAAQLYGQGQAALLEMGVLKLRTQGACQGGAGISINEISSSKKLLKSVAVAGPVVHSFIKGKGCCSAS